MELIDNVVAELGKSKLNSNEEVLRGEISEVLGKSENGEALADRLISFSGILKENKWSIAKYVKAVEFVTHRIGGDTIVGSYRKTFPERLTRKKRVMGEEIDEVEDKPYDTIRSAAKTYEQGELVQKLMAQVQIPLHIIMMNERVRAAEVLANLMVNGETERIQMESADKLLNHVKAPEVVQMEIDMTVTTDETLSNINESLDRLASLAQKKIEQGVITPVEVIES